MKLERTNFDLQQNSTLLIADVIGRLCSELHKQLNKQLEDLWIEGLKRKGLKFQKQNGT